MKNSEFVCPTTVDEAAAQLKAHRGSKAIAGGTDLLVQLRFKGQSPPPLFVSLNDIPALKNLDLEGTTLRIGGGVTLATLATSPLVKSHAPLLAQAAAMMASVHVRSRATVAGNLCNASPAADLAPPLLVLEATVTLQSKEGTRKMPLSEFLRGPGQTALKEGELLTVVEVPQALGCHGTYVKHQVSACADLSIVSVAALVSLDREGKILSDARIALGAVAPTAIRLPEVEKELRGKPAEAEHLQKAATRASQICQPIDDLRSSCDHRCHLVAVLVPEAIEAAVRQAKGSEE